MPPTLALEKLAQLGLETLEKHGWRVARALEELGPAVAKAQRPILERALPQIATKNLQRIQGLSSTEATTRVFGQHIEDAFGLLEPVKEGAWSPYLRPLMPASLTPPTETKRLGRVMGLFKNIASPSNMGEYFLGSKGNWMYDINGVELAKLPGTAQHMAEWYKMAHKVRSAADNPQFMHDATQALEPLFANGTIQKYSALTGQMNNLTRTIQNARGRAAFRLDKTRAQLRELIPQVEQLHNTIQSVRVPLMQRWAQAEPGIRMGLALEPTEHPWVTKLLRPEEKRIVDFARKYIDMAHKEGKAVGIPVLEGEYAPHFMAPLLDRMQHNVQGIAKDFLLRVPTEMRWQHRTPGSMMWFPDIQTMMRTYITQSNNKFAYTRFLNKWEPYLEGRGNRYKGQGLLQTNQDAYNYIKNYLRDYMRAEEKPSAWGKAADAMVWAEYVSKIGGSTTTAVKHGFKQLYMLATHPNESIQALPLAIQSSVRNALAKTGVPQTYADRVMRQLLSAKYMYRAMTGLQAPSTSQWRKVQSVLEGMTSGPVMMVEYFERGSAIMTGMLKGMNRGLSFQESMRGMYQLMLDLNFMGGIDRPTWLNSPLRRLSFLFFYTPFKILERNLGKLPAGAVQNLGKMWQNRNALAKAASETIADADIGPIKAALVKASANMRTDAFGTPYLGQFVRAAILLGLTDQVARHAFDTDVRSHILHFPGTRHTPWGWELSLPPYLQVFNKWKEYGGDIEGMKVALAEHLVPTMISRVYRIARGDIPEMYGGSEERYMLGLPMLSAQEAIYSRKEPGIETKQKRLKQRALERHQRNAPEWLQLDR